MNYQILFFEQDARSCDMKELAFGLNLLKNRPIFNPIYGELTKLI